MRSVPDRHHISDKVFQLLEPLLPGARGLRAGIAKNNRPFITGLVQILSTGAASPDFAESMGDRAIPSVDLLGGKIRVANDRHRSDQSCPTCSCSGQRESEKMSRPKEAQHKLYLAVDWNGRLIRAIIRAGTTADCCQAEMRPVLAPKKDRKYQRNDNHD